MIWIALALLFFLSAILLLAACIASSRFTAAEAADERLAEPEPAPKRVQLRYGRYWRDEVADIYRIYEQQVEAANGRR